MDSGWQVRARKKVFFCLLQLTRYTLTQCRFNAGPASAMLGQHWIDIGSGYYVFVLARSAIVLGRENLKITSPGSLQECISSRPTQAEGGGGAIVHIWNSSRDILRKLDFMIAFSGIGYKSIAITRKNRNVKRQWENRHFTVSLWGMG